MRLLAGVPADLTEDGRGEEDRQWSFVHAGQWLGDVLAKMRSPENLQPPAAGETLQGDLAALSGDGRQLAAVPVGPGPGGLPGRRHGAGQDDPGSGVVLGLEGPEERSGQSLAPGASGLAAGQLEGGDGPLRADAPRGFLHPAETPKEELDRIAADPGRGVARRRRRRDQLRHALAAGMADGNSLAVGGAGRGAGHQEPGRPADEGRQAAAGRRPHRPDRHARREPLVRSLVAVRFSLSGPAGHAGQVQGVRQETGRPPGEPLRAAAEPGAAVHPAAAEDRPPHHRRPAREGRSPGLLRTFQAAGRDVRQAGPRTGRNAEERRRHASGAGWCWPT